MKKLLILIICALSFFIIVFTLKQFTRPDSSLSPNTSLIPIRNPWKDRHIDLAYEQKTIYAFPPSVVNQLEASDASQRVPFHCSDPFIRNWEAIYFMQDPKTTKFSIGLDNDTMLEYMRHVDSYLPTPALEQKFLKGVFCEAKNGDTFLEYHRGMQKQVFDNFYYLGEHINTYLLYYKKQATQSTVIDLTAQSLGPQLFCMPLQLQANGKLYYKCDMRTETDVTITYYQVQTQTSAAAQKLASCTITFIPAIKKVCTEN